jgi:isopropylmalate/homocitrate/citramalate synthase
MPANQPVSGDDMYRVESGIPASWWLRVRDTHPTELYPVLPSFLGQGEPQIVLGKGSGVDSVGYWLKRSGFEASPEQTLELTTLVKERSLEKKGLLTEEEFRKLAGRVIPEEVR